MTTVHGPTRPLVPMLCGLLMLAVVFAPEARAQGDPDRPKIGLALSGGGAKGAAHVGVLKRLEELNIPIDYIAGTSMGAIVGGLYASGMTADELAKAIEGIDWNAALEDQPPRKDMAFRRKEDTARYATDIQLGVGKGGIKFPPGLKSGQKLYLLLQTMTMRAGSVTDFDDLPIPFRCVATDIQNGEPVVLSDGNLARALRASMAIPSAFAPVIIDGVTLVDGGITNNLPVQLARDMGADIVIAVDLGAPLDDRQVDNLLEIYNQMSRMLIRKNVEEQLEYADLIIHPPVAHFGTMGFKNIDAILAQGYETAVETTDQLSRFSIDPDEYRRHREPQIVSEPRLPVVHWVDIEGNDRVDSRIIKNELHLELGEPLDFGRLFKDIGRIYGLGDFQQVSYRLSERNGEAGLVIRVTEKPWGPNYLMFGFRLASSFDSDLLLGVRFNVTLTRLNALGAEWRNDLQFGTISDLFSEIYQPLQFKDGFFVAGSFAALSENSDYYVDGQNIAEYELRRTQFRADIGYHFGKSSELRVGALRGGARSSWSRGSVRTRTTMTSIPAARAFNSRTTRWITRIFRKRACWHTDARTIPARAGARISTTIATPACSANGGRSRSTSRFSHSASVGATVETWRGRLPIRTFPATTNSPLAACFPFLVFTYRNCGANSPASGGWATCTI